MPSVYMYSQVMPSVYSQVMPSDHMITYDTFENSITNPTMLHVLPCAADSYHGFIFSTVGRIVFMKQIH